VAAAWQLPSLEELLQKARVKRSRKRRRMVTYDGTPKLAVNPAGAGEEKKGGSDLVTAAAPNVACGGFEER
jgi:hypothetical protein